MKKQNSTPKMTDVAREAGVALGTVSKVVNGLPVSESYRIRVEDAIRKLNYQVDSYARGLKSKKTNTVALLLPDIQEPFLASLASHINSSLLKRRQRMLLCTTDFDPVREQESVTLAQQSRVDGIIGLVGNSDLVIEDSLPFVSIDHCMRTGIPCVSSDNFGGGQLAARKLADLGCKNVAFLCVGSNSGFEMDKRKIGFERECFSREIACEIRVLGNGETYAESEEFLASHICNGKLDFDGIFCMTDVLAYSVMKILYKMGQKIPEDVQIIGFDGIRPFPGAGYLGSTIVQPVAEIAETCVELLFQENVPTKPALICLPVSFGYGGTTLDCLEEQRI